MKIKKIMYFVTLFLFILLSSVSCSHVEIENDNMIESDIVDNGARIEKKLSDFVLNYWDMFSENYAYDLYFKKSEKKYQGLAINSDIIFQTVVNGFVNVTEFDKDISYKEKMGSYSNTNHANSCNSTKIDDIIYLYVTNGDNGQTMMCSVEKFENNVFSNVQNIYLNQDDFEQFNYVKNWGWPCWLISNDSDYLYTFSSKYKTNGSMRKYDEDNNYVLSKFKRPNFNYDVVTLSGKDIIDQLIFPYEVEYTQGGCIENNCLCYSFGKNTREFPNKLMFIDIRKSIVLGIMDISEIYSYEIESCCFYGDKLYLQYEDGSIYYIYYKGEID